MIAARRMRAEQERYREHAEKALQERVDLFHDMPDGDEAIIAAQRLDSDLEWDDPRKDKVLERYTQLAKWKVATLWEAAKAGDVGSLKHLNILTSDRKIDDPYDEYAVAWYTSITRTQWLVPEEYYELVATIVENPSTSLLKITRKPTQLDIEIAMNDTLENPTLLKAKSILALWRAGHEIPLKDVEPIISIINRLHESLGLFQKE